MSEAIIETTDMPEHVREALSILYGLNGEIIRCKDCKFSMFDRECSRVDPWVDETWFAIEPDGFCKWGEWKDE
jgi:hypothetical protein